MLEDQCCLSRPDLELDFSNSETSKFRAGSVVPQNLYYADIVACTAVVTTQLPRDKQICQSGF
jgi:hypothetical protein